MWGGERPLLTPQNLLPGSAQSANLRASDYQKPLPTVPVMTEPSC